MRLIELALLYLLDRIKQNANSDVSRYVPFVNTTYIDPTARGQDGNIASAFLIMDFHRSRMNEFLCHKFLITDHDLDDRSDIYLVDDGNVNTTKSIKESQQRILISDVGSRQYKTWLTKMGQQSIRETRQSPPKYGYARLAHRNFNPTTSRYTPYRKKHEKFTMTKNRRKSHAKPPLFVSKNRFKNNWKKRRFHELRQPEFHRSYGRENAPLHGPLPPPPSDSASTVASTPWFVSPEPQHSSPTNVTMNMDYNFWDTDSHPTPPSHRYDDSISYEHSPSFHGGEIAIHDHYQSHDDHHPIIWQPSSDKNCDCDDDDDKNDDSDDSKDEGPLAKLMKNDLYHTVLIVFAFIGFTTFFMNMMSGLNIGNNSQMPSIMFVGNNNEEDDEEARKFARVKHEVHLNNLMERSARYIEQFQEILLSMSDDGEV